MYMYMYDKMKKTQFTLALLGKSHFLNTCSTLYKSLGQNRKYFCNLLLENFTPKRI